MTHLRKKILWTFVLGCLSTSALPQEGYGVGGGTAPTTPPPTTGTPPPTTGGPVVIPGLTDARASDIDTPTKWKQVIEENLKKDTTANGQRRLKKWNDLVDQANGQMEVQDKLGRDCKADHGKKARTNNKYLQCLKRSGNPGFTRNFYKSLSNTHFCPHASLTLDANVTGKTSSMNVFSSNRGASAQTVFGSFTKLCAKRAAEWLD